MKKQYCSEDELVEKFQKSEIGWLEYVTNHSKEWDEEFAEFVKKRGLPTDNDSALSFLESKEAQMDFAHSEGNL